ncbi:MAG: diaminopimelate epimerase [Clostridia bacterium]|nr:diaminopimelate epimerase [Clostridia bacterium]
MLKFTKMQGLGNDYVYMDAIHQKIGNASALVKAVSNRHWGIGSDGLILIDKSNVADFKMQMFNPDGSESEMCGNGIRCVGKFVYDKELTNSTEITIETLAGIKKLKLKVQNGKVERITVDMGEPILEPDKIPVLSDKMPVKNLKIEALDREFLVTCVSMGNPHAVILLEDVEKFDIEKYGKEIESNPNFPNKTNVEFVEVEDKKHIKMRVWERGTGETLACGTGACSSVVAGVLNGVIDRNSIVKLLGGNLQIEWKEDDNHVYMTGPAVTVFEGEIYEENILYK